MRRRLPLLFATLLAGIAPAALADDALPLPETATAERDASTEVELELTIGGRPVGKQTVTIRYRPPRDPKGEETRIIEVYTELRGSIAGKELFYTSRQTGRAAGRTMSFTSVVDENGARREVQGRRHKDGSWTLVTNAGGADEVQELRRSQANLCTMDLYDPKLHDILVDAPSRMLLVSETGVVVQGTTENIGEVAATIGQTESTVERMAFEGSGLKLQFDWNLEGVPVAWQGQILGQRVTARAKLAPAPRAWGRTSVSSRFDNGNAIRESDL
jgi:hypothetical protein